MYKEKKIDKIKDKWKKMVRMRQIMKHRSNTY